MEVEEASEGIWISVFAAWQKTNNFGWSFLAADQFCEFGDVELFLTTRFERLLTAILLAFFWQGSTAWDLRGIGFELVLRTVTVLVWLVLLLEGRNGGGSPDYFDWIKPLVNGTFEKELRENFTVGGYIFFLNCEQAARFNILMYSSIPAETVAPMGIKSYDNLDKLMEDAHLEGKSIYVIPTGSTVLPDVIG